MENITPIAVPPVAMVVPSMASTGDPTVPPTVESALPNPCRNIVLYQLEVGGSAHSPSPESTPSPPSPPVSQKPCTFLGKAPPISKKVRPSLSSPSPPVSKRVTHSSSSHQSPSKPVGPPRPPPKVSIPTPTSERVQTKQKSSTDTMYQPPEKKSKKKPTPVASTESSPKRSSKGSKKSKLPKAPISTVDPATVQCLVVSGFVVCYICTSVLLREFQLSIS
ncbi:proline-rich receptor-like protein kinase PERK9 [Cannabis sativa]|uniref:proline-rich receptor-like protein kinase PERK9 n=1 Tax=Cannabis sativa TaxID=3483 RepID=UPI0029CA516D|nr:proline-rich receptor-like protein kinase PERK9 [Cannabis sativa]